MTQRKLVHILLAATLVLAAIVTPLEVQPETPARPSDMV